MTRPLHTLLHGIDSSFFKSINAASYSKDIFTILNRFLTDRSYLQGYRPSLVDSQVLDSLDGASLSIADLNSDFPHVTRWWRHIDSLRLDPIYRQCFLKESEGSVCYKVRSCMASSSISFNPLPVVFFFLPSQFSFSELAFLLFNFLRLLFTFFCTKI